MNKQMFRLSTSRRPVLVNKAGFTFVSFVHCSCIDMAAAEEEDLDAIKNIGEEPGTIAFISTYIYFLLLLTWRHVRNTRKNERFASRNIAQIGVW